MLSVNGKRRDKLNHPPINEMRPVKSIQPTINAGNIHNKVGSRNWETAEQGFWMSKPYFALSDSFLYETEKVVMYQHIIIDEEDKIHLYRFWHHFFSDSDLRSMLSKHGFNEISFHSNIIPGGDGYESEDITFCIARNNTNHKLN